MECTLYTHSMETIYLSLSAQVAVGTFFMKSLVSQLETFKLHVFVKKETMNTSIL